MIWLILLSLASAVLYRLGGWGDEGRDKFPKLPEWVFDTKARDIGCAAVWFVAMKYVIHFVAPWWIHLISFLMLFGFLTTYWDWAPWNKGKDNFYNHGTACAMAYLPYAFYAEPTALVVRVIVCGALMGFWSWIIGLDWLEEGGRGFILIATLGLLFWL